MLEVVRYTSDKKDEWDAFVKESDNSSFLFYRDYMEYHEDRFKDFSLLLYDKNKLCALLPGNILNDEFISHQGLTFGGIISSNNFGYNKANKYIGFFALYEKQSYLSDND